LGKLSKRAEFQRKSFSYGNNARLDGASEKGSKVRRGANYYGRNAQKRDTSLRSLEEAVVKCKGPKGIRKKTDAGRTTCGGGGMNGRLRVCPRRPCMGALGGKNPKMRIDSGGGADLPPCGEGYFF